MKRDVAHMPEVGPLRVLEVRQHAAGRGHRGRGLLESVPRQRCGAKLFAEHLTRPGWIERPAIDSRHAAGRSIGQQAVDRGAVGSQELFRSQQTQFGREGGQRLGAGEFRRGKLAGGDVQKRETPGAIGPRERHGREERRLPRFEIARVGEGARRHDPGHFAPDEALGLARVLDLIADRHAVAFAHEPREVHVQRVKWHAAHRNGRALRVLRAGCQRQLEHARGHERVLVEQLVEIAHPEANDRVAVVAFDLEVLPHGRRSRLHRGRRGAGRRHGSIRQAITFC